MISFLRCLQNVCARGTQLRRNRVYDRLTSNHMQNLLLKCVHNALLIFVFSL